MSFGIIIPNRNDRPRLTDHCLFQIESQTKQPDYVFHINEQPKNQHVVDLAYRIKLGIIKGIEIGVEFFYVFENDDYYPNDYLENLERYRLSGNFELIGFDSTIYYHIGRKQWIKINHPGRSSLFTTGFASKIGYEILNMEDHYLWVDIKLWKTNYSKKLIKMDNYKEFPIGIKHGLGFCGGMGHLPSFNYTFNDSKQFWLKKHTRTQSFELYNMLLSE